MIKDCIYVLYKMINNCTFVLYKMINNCTCVLLSEEKNRLGDIKLSRIAV
mgnify:FL=1